MTTKQMPPDLKAFRLLLRKYEKAFNAFLNAETTNYPQLRAQWKGAKSALLEFVSIHLSSKPRPPLAILVNKPFPTEEEDHEKDRKNTG